MIFEKALAKLRSQEEKIIREKNSGNEYSLSIKTDEIILYKKSAYGLIISNEHSISCKEIFSKDWELGSEYLEKDEEQANE